MVAKTYIPDRGDVVWITLNPQAGHEQAGRRPALVVSPKKYNIASGLALTCPMTSQIKGYPFEVLISNDSCVLADQIKSLDWHARGAELKEKVGAAQVAEVLGKIMLLFQED